MKNSLLFLLLALFTGSSFAMQSDEAFAQPQDQEKMREARDAARNGLDLYKMLDLRGGATTQEIQVAGRKKLARLHPDRGGNAQEFQRINNAYSILKDAQARTQYDRMRAAREAARNGLDLYKMLDLREGATAQEINVAGRKKLARLHPDRDAQEYQRINNAYSILKDLQARTEYDKTRKKFSRSVWQERRQKFMNNVRNYKQSIIVATASAATTALALSYQAVNCGDVARAICNGQLVNVALLQGCANYLPSRLDCLLGGW